MLKSIVAIFLFGLLFLGTKAQEANPEIKVNTIANLDGADTVIFIGETVPDATIEGLPTLTEELKVLSKLHPKFTTHMQVYVPETIGATVKRLIFAGTGPLASDTADSRNIYDAASKATSLAYVSGPKDGTQKILIIVDPALVDNTVAWRSKDLLDLNAALGALYALYKPKEIRELPGDNPKKMKYYELYIFKATDDVITWAKYIEEGRWVARDICGGDPETMNTENIMKYINDSAKFSTVEVKVLDILKESHPLVAAVNRGSEKIPRHNGRILQLTYTNGNPTKAAYFAGKGVTLDTGGLDLKISNTMVGHHRDKCGAAAIIGFFKTLEFVKPTNVKFMANLAILRNNLGSSSYSTDEILMARSGKRIKIGFTDAEGRLLVSDLVNEVMDEALTDNIDDKMTDIYSVGTYTEHVTKMYKFITGAIENGVARKAGVLDSLQKSSELLSDPLEITLLRREDYTFNVGPLETEDLRNSNPGKDVSTQRGSQVAAAFIIQASGMEEHGRGTENPLRFVHLDVTGSVGDGDTVPTASPLTLLATHYLLPETLKSPTSKN
uniref:CYTOSOL_AP domain-containing protein n=1 Tax=Mesocestoides corti TaxID=53468 RepID=A0A5K3EPV8_MESCO